MPEILIDVTDDPVLVVDHGPIPFARRQLDPESSHRHPSTPDATATNPRCLVTESTCWPTCTSPRTFVMCTSVQWRQMRQCTTRGDSRENTAAITPQIKRERTVALSNSSRGTDLLWRNPVRRDHIHRAAPRLCPWDARQGFASATFRFSGGMNCAEMAFALVRPDRQRRIGRLGSPGPCQPRSCGAQPHYQASRVGRLRQTGHSTMAAFGPTNARHGHVRVKAELRSRAVP
jgi:hypothetical protein